MKKNFFYLLIAAIMGTFTLVSCNDDDDVIKPEGKQAKELVGSWTLYDEDEYGTENITITFEKNGKGNITSIFTSEKYPEENGTFTTNFTWATNGNKLSIMFTEEGKTITRTGAYEIKGNTLTLRDDEDNSYEVYTKK